MTIPDGYYYRSRPGPTEPVDWTRRIDPDGRVRIRETERALLVDDTREAVSFLSCNCARVLDYGCGFGFAAHELARHAARGHGMIVGVEPDRGSRERARDLTDPSVPIYADTSGLEDAAFDGCLSWNVLEHATDPLGYLRDAARLVAPGGWLVAQTPNFESEIARAWGERYRMLADATHISHFGEPGLRRALRDTGWIVTEVRHEYLRTRFNTPANNAKLTAPGSGVSPAGIGNTLTACARRASPRQAEILCAIGQLEREL